MFRKKSKSRHWVRKRNQTRLTDLDQFLRDCATVCSTSRSTPVASDERESACSKFTIHEKSHIFNSNLVGVLLLPINININQSPRSLRAAPHTYTCASRNLTHMSSATSSTCSHGDSKCIAVPNDAIIPSHNYANLEQDTENLAQGHMKHISEDIKLLQQDLPDGIYVRYASERPAFMKCLITGVESTPYAHGLFEFDLYCPPNYPVSPPKVHFCTTGKSPSCIHIRTFTYVLSLR